MFITAAICHRIFNRFWRNPSVSSLFARRCLLLWAWRLSFLFSSFEVLELDLEGIFATSFIFIISIIKPIFSLRTDDA